MPTSDPIEKKRNGKAKERDMSVSYASEYPDISVDPAVKAFFETFYRVSDTPDAHEEYARSFTPGATLVMASTKACGYDSR